MIKRKGRIPPNPESLRSARKAEKRKIRILNNQYLEPIDWSSREELQQFVKNIYQEHIKSSIRLPTEVANYCNKHQITINGTAPKPILNFNESSFPNYFLTNINKLDYKEPTPLQAFCWPIALRGYNLLGIAKAKTGSGKILAFLLPTILHAKSQPKLEEDDGPIAIILTSNRERAQQIETIADVFASSASVRSVCLSGISKIKPAEQLELRPEFIISTPDRVTEFYIKRKLNFNRCTYVVLDQVDRMMNFGYASQIRKIFGRIRPDRQVLMWSASWSKEVGELASDLLGDYVKVNKGALELYSNQNIIQHFHICNERRKGPKLKELLDYLYKSTANNPGKIIIFMARASRVRHGIKFLKYYGRQSVGLYGALKNRERENALKDFIQGDVNILLATDLVGREVEIDGVSYVINFDFPLTVQSYVLRIAYAGRQSKRGTAYTFFTRANVPSAKELITVLREANQTINPILEGLLREEILIKSKRRKNGGNGGNCGLNLGAKGKNLKSEQKEELKSGKRKQTLTKSEGECSSAKRRDDGELEENNDSDDDDDNDDDDDDDDEDGDVESNHEDVESDDSESSEFSGIGASYDPNGIPGYIRPPDDLRPNGCNRSGEVVRNNGPGIHIKTDHELGFGINRSNVAAWGQGRNNLGSGPGFGIDRGNSAMWGQWENNFGGGPGFGNNQGNFTMWEQGRSDFGSGPGPGVGRHYVPNWSQGNGHGFTPCHESGLPIGRGNVENYGQVRNDSESGPVFRTAYEAGVRSGIDSDDIASRSRNHPDRGAGFINEGPGNGRRNDRHDLSNEIDLRPSCEVEFANDKCFVEKIEPRNTDFSRTVSFRSSFDNDRYRDEFVGDRSRSGSKLRSDDGIGFGSERRIDEFKSRVDFEHRSRESDNEIQINERFDFGDEARFNNERRSQERTFFDRTDNIRSDDARGFRNDGRFVQRRSAERADFEFKDEKQSIGRFEFGNEDCDDWARSRKRNEYEEDHWFRADDGARFDNERDVERFRNEKISDNLIEDDVDNTTLNDLIRSRDIDWINRKKEEPCRSPSPQHSFLHDIRNDFSNNRDDAFFDRDEYIAHNQPIYPGFNKRSNARRREESPYENRYKNDLSYTRTRFRSPNNTPAERHTDFSTKRDERDSLPQRNSRFRSPCTKNRLNEARGSDEIFTRRNKQRFDGYSRGFNDRNQKSGNKRAFHSEFRHNSHENYN